MTGPRAAAMGLTVVGSIAFDRVKSPFGERERMLGGAATYFALAASFFDTVTVVGPVGDDFGEEHIDVLRTRGTNVSDIERVPGGRTFFWHGEYGWDLNQCQTHATELGVFAEFEPKLSPASQGCDVLFLANIQPSLQLAVRESLHARPLRRPRLDELLDRERPRRAPRGDPAGRLRAPERRRAAPADRPAEPGHGRARAAAARAARRSSPSRASTARA